MLKEAYKLPLPKPNKNEKLMDNYRGITITSVFCKVLEIFIEQRSASEIDHNLSDLQCGFTKGRSPSLASLLITEAVAECKQKREDLYIVSFDARKAFDVVSHQILKSKLFLTPVNRTVWKLIDDLYISPRECIRWKNSDSRPYEVEQGVRQGGILSPLLYKLYINDLLILLEKKSMGMKIGINLIHGGLILIFGSSY